MLPKKLMCTVPFCLIGLLAIILLTTAAGLEVEEKEIKPTQLIRKSTRLIILYLTPVGKYPMILHDRSFFICFYPFFIKPHLKSEADLYIP